MITKIMIFILGMCVGFIWNEANHAPIYSEWQNKYDLMKEIIELYNKVNNNYDSKLLETIKYKELELKDKL